MLKKLPLLFASILITAASYAQKYSSFNHVSLYVSNLKVSAAFYTKLFHLDTVKAPFPGQPTVWLKLGPHMQLHLVQGKKEDIVVSPENHIAFSVQSLYDFTVILKEENVYYEGEGGKPGTFVTRSDGVKQLYLKDPDGYRVEVNDAPY